MKQIRIEVIGKRFYEDLAKDYGSEGLTKCPFHRVGEVFYTNYCRPNGFCDDAWDAIHHYVFAMTHGAKGPWCNSDSKVKENEVIVCCQDGLRPTLFKITREDVDTARGYFPPIPPTD